MTHDEMMENRKTNHYNEFINGWYVNTVEAIARPLVQQTSSNDEDEFKFPPWDQNMLRWEVR